MESTLGTAVRAVFDRGGGEVVGSYRFIPLVTLDSGARYGIDAELRWIVTSSEGGLPVAIGADTAHLLHEALEWKRDTFDEALEASARDNGLPVDEVVFAFPTTALVRAILERRSSYLTRLALAFLRTTELRELRDDILAVTRDTNMPSPIRDFAERLVVPV